MEIINEFAQIYIAISNIEDMVSLTSDRQLEFELIMSKLRAAVSEALKGLTALQS